MFFLGLTDSDYHSGMSTPSVSSIVQGRCPLVIPSGETNKHRSELAQKSLHKLLALQKVSSKTLSPNSYPSPEQPAPLLPNPPCPLVSSIVQGRCPLVIPSGETNKHRSEQAQKSLYKLLALQKVSAPPTPLCV